MTISDSMPLFVSLSSIFFAIGLYYIGTTESYTDGYRAASPRADEGEE